MVPQEIAPPSEESKPNEPSVPIIEFFQLLFDFSRWGLKDQANQRHFACSSILPPNVYLTLIFPITLAALMWNLWKYTTLPNIVLA